ncbi:MAG TPA: phosphatase PAP2 family protein, partial [Rhodocyclaceae bacterium]|nr:phosphatase PAP2 family protein [Rhodocyclaceae bacterium]
VRYGWSIGGVCLVGLVFFYWFPTSVPPAAVDWSMYPGFDFLKKIDTAGNACPSLHVAAAAFSGVWLHRQLGEMGAGRWVLLVNAIWGAAILYSTLATKQHVFLDLAAGLLLGLVGVWLSLRWIAPPLRPAVLAARA